ncbi:MAG TPA: type II secretion system F family protein [Phycisphaerae bacterium]|nr:type II secretion system F family protein [Phycisphaerae bacterium]
MAIYEYTARAPDGKEVVGTIQAESDAAVARTLGERGVFPIAVRAQANTFQMSIGGGKVRLRDLGVFYGQFADLLRAGVPVLRALDTLSKAITNRALAQLISNVSEGVSEGKSLAESMGAYPDTFTKLHTSMVQAGERAGFLEDVFTDLSNFIDRQDDLRSKVRGAMIYPMVLVTIGSVLIFFVLIYLVPQFQSVFSSMKSLPAPTRMMFALSDFLRGYWFIALVAAAAVSFGVWSFVRSKSGKLLWDRWRIRIPIAGKVTRAVCITRFCRILGTMLHNGVPILNALDISKGAAGNAALEENIAQAAESVEAGQTLAEPLGKGGMFPVDVVEMIAIGEESNQLERILLQVAETTDRRTQRSVDQAVRLIEPLILVFIAGIIGFIAVGLLYPIFTMSRTLQ